ncbi:hypothetical protein ATO3_17660 [Marinibacterium profundimaris]|uniref:catalase n=2 Tax=Marinibacterium profundimaris TaxID=1679460 RepID=A0A225NIQ0_9RHOB|nr:hypothetical protein ATO3_17660 [Marinibacterium profundimaris]
MERKFSVWPDGEKAQGEALFEALWREDGNAQRRPVHTNGIGVRGHFIASPVARSYCVAEHFGGDRIEVTGRFSNGSGADRLHDGWTDVRGLAIRFHLTGGTEARSTDLLAMTLPAFFAPEPRSAWDFINAAHQEPYDREGAWDKVKDYLQMMLPRRNPYPGETTNADKGGFEYANKNLFAQLPTFGAATIGAPASYARAAYHAVHTFVVTGSDDVDRYVRFTWQPVSGVQPAHDNDPPRDAFLQDELRERLAGDGKAEFSLMMQLGDIGDDFDDCSRPWPPHRVRIMMGTLTITDVAEDQEADSEKLSFNPWLLTPGIAPSGDPILKARRDAYRASSENRHATPCPFAKD